MIQQPGVSTLRFTFRVVYTLPKGPGSYMGTPLSPKYTPYTYMDPPGFPQCNTKPLNYIRCLSDMPDVQGPSLDSFYASAS